MNARLLACFGSLAIVLAACGSERSPLTQSLSGALTGLFQRNVPQPTLRERLTPDVLVALGGPILIVELLQDESEAGAQLTRTLGDLETWSTLNSIQFTFKQGVLMSTRGLQGDLMASDLSEVLRAMRSGGKGAVRVHRYLDGEEQEVARALVCDYTVAGRERVTVLTGTYTTTRIDETCVSSTEQIDNTYWFDQSGTMRRSRQWIGPFAGYAAFERIND